jgi:hypothetical protein
MGICTIKIHNRRVGQHYTKPGVLLCILFLCLSVVFSTVSSAQDVTISVSMLQGEQQTRFNRPVLVAGIWHYLNITTDQDYNELSLRLYKGIIMPSGEKNETNYYEWSYNTSAPLFWTNENTYSVEYIQPALCQKANNQYSFCIGLKDFMPNVVDYYENWTVEVSHDGTTVYSTPIVVEKPKTGVSLSKPSSIIFHVDPFTIMDAAGDTFFKIGNIGNIPLNVSFDSQKYSEVEINDVNTIMLPNQTITHYATIHSKSWPPGFKTITIELTGSYLKSYFVDTNATVTLYSSFIIDVPQLVIYVGHSNYKIDEIDGAGITFQYIENLKMYEGETRDITAYVSGNGPVTVQIGADEKNISLIKLSDNSIDTSSPFSFTSTNTTERILKITVRALREGTTGVLTYQITGNGITETYTTHITIGPPKSTPEEETAGGFSLMQLVIIVIVLLVAIYMIITYLRHRKR